jgi:hypothetical protein
MRRALLVEALEDAEEDEDPDAILRGAHRRWSDKNSRGATRDALSPFKLLLRVV